MTTITIAPAGPKTATAVIRALLEQTAGSGTEVQIRAYYRDTARAPREFSKNPHFLALQGDMADRSSLDFSGSDAVLAITPPIFDGRDMIAQAELMSMNVRKAVEAAGTVKKLVLLSSQGAHLSEGVGEIKTNNVAERILSQTDVARISIARCPYFMENWAMGISSLQGPEPFIFSTITPLDYAIPMVAVADIGTILARELLSANPAAKEKSPYIFDVEGPGLYSPYDVQKAFSKAINGEVGIKPVEKAGLGAFFGQVLPADAAKQMEEMTVAFLPGGVMIENPDPVSRDSAQGETTLDDAIKEVVRHFVSNSH